MAQFNKKTVYTALGLLAVGVVAYLYTEPETPAKKATGTRTATKSKAKGDDTQITEEDLKAKFPRVSVAARDAFQPGVTTGKAGGGKALAKPTPLKPVIIPPPPVKPVEGIQALSTWTLTGISFVDGVRTALIENKASGDSTFLKAGSFWKGLRVASITSEELVFVEPTGKVRRVTFPEPPEEKSATPRTAASMDPGTGGPTTLRNSRRGRRTNVAGLSSPDTDNGAES